MTRRPPKLVVPWPCVAVVLAACSSAGDNKPPLASSFTIPADAGASVVQISTRDAGAGLAAGGDGADASSTDAAAATPDAGAADAATSPALVIYPRLGSMTDDTTTPAGPGLVLDGGTMVAAALTWARTTLRVDVSSPAFDVVIVAAAGGDQSAFLYNSAPFASAQTLVIGPGATANDFAAAAAIVSRAELVFFPGGEQSGYAVWNRTALSEAIQGVYDRGGVIAGTSAGALILGAFAFDALDAGGISENVTPALALANPYDPQITFTRHMFSFPPLADAITEVHFEQRDRMGRLAMFMARQPADNAVVRVPPVVLGIAVDEHAAIVIDGHGNGLFLRDDPVGRAFIVKGGPPTVCAPGQRLVYSGLEVHRFDDTSQTFDFNRWCGTAPVYTLDISDDAAAPFGATSAYDRDAAAATCP